MNKQMAQNRARWDAYKADKKVTLAADRKNCPLCGRNAVVLLTAKQLAQQPDGTTHVCHPWLGGCNQGYTDRP